MAIAEFLMLKMVHAKSDSLTTINHGENIVNLPKMEHMNSQKVSMKERQIVVLK